MKLDWNMTRSYHHGRKFRRHYHLRVGRLSATWHGRLTPIAPTFPYR